MSTDARLLFTGPELCRRQAHEVVELLRKGEISPTELFEATIARIGSVEPAINAMPTTCFERAKEAIAALSSNVEHAGWLAGLPIGIKDLMPVAGVRTTYGTLGMAKHIPETSDPLVERLEERGGIIVGKTNTPELGAGGNTFNDVFGITRNPWNTSLNAGGSSGGAAASLATGETWLSHGSDHGGSLRTPAAYCGIVGLRPTPGRAGGGSTEAGFIIEGTQGPMARSVQDCALFLDAMAGFEPRYPISFPAPDRSFQQTVLNADGKVRIGFAPDLNGLSPVEIEIDNHIRNALTSVEKNGGTVVEICPDLSGLERTYHALRGILWAAATKNMPGSVTRHFKSTLAENIAFGKALTMEDIVDANISRTTIYNNMLEFFQNFDVLACPTVGNMPRAVTQEWVKEINGYKLDGYMDWLRFAFLSTTTGLPAISVPVGLSNNAIPVAIQLIGPPRGEAKMLEVARAIEVAVGGPLGPIDPNITHEIER